MRIIRKSIYAILSIAYLMALSGCGSTNTQGPMVDQSGKHPANWIMNHRIAFRQTSGQCQDCHGTDLRGGITRIDCFNQAGVAICHANGHGPRTIIHPVPFKDPALHGPPARQDLVVCQGCHGTMGGPGENPRFNVKIGSLPAGCESPGCHLTGMAHPKPWPNHEHAGNIPYACSLCHGANLGGGSGRACSTCHGGTGKVPVPDQRILQP